MMPVPAENFSVAADAMLNRIEMVSDPHQRQALHDAFSDVLTAHTKAMRDGVARLANMPLGSDQPPASAPLAVVDGGDDNGSDGYSTY